MGTLSILLWKQLKERYRRMWYTLWEIFNGIIVFVILLFVKMILVDNQHHTIINSLDILYSPKNDFSDVLLRQVCSGVFDKSSQLHGTVINCYGFHSKKESNKYVANNMFLTSDSIFEINFENINDTFYPKELNYSIKLLHKRTENVMKLEDLYYIYYEPMFTVNNATVLANLQWEIDKSYMEMLSGQRFNHKLLFTPLVAHSTHEMRLIRSFLVLCTVLAPMSFFMHIHAALVDEKRSGIKEMLKLAGVYPSTIRYAHLVDTSIFAAIYAIIIVTLLKITISPILKYSNPIIIGVTIILHFWTITSLAFITSSCSQNYQHSDSLALLVYMMLFLTNILWYGRQLTSSVWFSLIFIPHSPVFMFWHIVISFESYDVGAIFSNIHKSGDCVGCTSVLVVWLLFIFQLMIILILAWYLDLVRPGKYGVALSWNFLFKVIREYHLYHLKKRKVVVHHILDQINLDIYRGDITVILGANGSGKSMLLSIVAGMFSASRGHVYINGLDIETRIHDLRRDLSFCPQLHFTFDLLTVRENLTFYYKIAKSATDLQAVDADHMLRLFNMTDKAHFHCKDISESHQKCLQLACVLLSNAEVLVFDEPTLGMDAKMRHTLWDLLLKLRKEKTILMTSSLMEEADALGDRVAVIHRGKLKCHASPAFLKNSIGNDVELSIRLSQTVDSTNVKTAIQNSEVPEAEHLRITRTEQRRLSVHLPAEKRDSFPKIFNFLENKRGDLGILSISMGVTMDNVFKKFVDDRDEDFDPYTNIPAYENGVRLSGCKLRCQQLKVLIKRAWMLVWSHQYQFFILQVLVPLVALIIVTVTSNTSSGYGSFLPSLRHKSATVIYPALPSPFERTADVTEPLLLRYPLVQFIRSMDVEKDVTSTKVYQQEQKIGIKSRENSTEIIYPLSSEPVLPIAVNIISNMLLLTYFPGNLRSSINMTYIPLWEGNMTSSKHVYLCYCWGMWVTFFVIIPLGPLLLLCVQEYYTGVRFTHLLMGCPPYIIWLSKLIAHMTIYLVIVPWSVLFVAGILDMDSTFNRPQFLGALLLLLIVFGLAYLTHWYVFSFMMSGKRPIGKIYVASFIFGLVAPLFLYVLSEISTSFTALMVLLYVLYAFGNCSPAFTFSVGLSKIGKVARNNALCRLNYHLCPDDFGEDMYVTKDVCCESNGEPYSYYTNIHSGLLELLFLILQAIVYWTVLMMLQNRIIQSRWQQLLYNCNKKHMNFRPNPNRGQRVENEEEYVHNKMKEYRGLSLEERQSQDDVLLVEDLNRVKGIIRRKTHHSVKSISFAIKNGECLAILGLDGSGKTTTLGMVAGYTVVTSGEICVNGYFSDKERALYLSNVCWCTGTGLDDFLTGLSNIESMASLYGYEPREAKRIATWYTQYMGLSRFMNTLFGSYSPGCTNRLVMCVALVSSPRVVLLDELCASVDPYTRPLVTRAVQHLLAKDVACLIAEGSMDWKQIDELCTRVAFMDSGELVALGTVSEIRRELASGFSVIIKLRVDEAYRVTLKSVSQSASSLLSGKNLVPKGTVAELKDDFMETFPSSVLVDEHMSMLYFHIRDVDSKFSYSEVFKTIEALKKKYQIIEDYSFTETSMDEVICRVEQLLHGDEAQKQELAKIITLT